MKIFFIILCCCLFSSKSAAQETEQPSHKIGTSFSQDTALANNYLKKIQPFAIRENMLDSALYYLQKVYGLSRYRHYKKGLAEYYRLIAVTYNTRHLYDSAMAAVKKEFYWSRQTGIPSTMIESYASKGIIYQYRAELDSSVKYYIKALQLSDSVKDKKMSGMLANNISILFENIGDHKNSAKYARAGYRIGRELNDSLIFINCLFNLAATKMDIQQYDSAMVMFEQVKEMVKNSSRFHYMAINALIDEGNLLDDQGKSKESIAKYEKVLQQKEQLRPYILSYAYSNLGSSLQQMGQMKKAETNFRKAIRIDKQIKRRNELRQNFRSLSEVKEAQKQFEAALKFRKKYEALNDTLMSEATKKNMHRLQVTYQTAKKDKQIAQQKLTLIQKQNAIERKNAWMWGIITGLIALAIIFVLFWRNYRQKRKLHHQTVLTMQKAHEVNTLKTKMDTREEERNRIGREMHDDVGSALTTILYLSGNLKNQTNGSGNQTAERIAYTAETVMDKMSEIIWSMNREYDTLDDLIVYSRQHAAGFLENHGLKYSIDAPDPVPDIHLQGEQRRNIYLVIKESLHNVVKHARASRVTISFRPGKNLKVIIRDNGNGIDLQNTGRFRNGLKNMKQRMESIGGSFVIKNNGGTEITLQCPLHKDEFK